MNKESLREVLGISCSLSEAELHSRTFIEDLIKRGMQGLKLVISDHHSGLTAALKATLLSVPWPRCLFHLAQNASSHAPCSSMRVELCQAVKEVYQAMDAGDVKRRLRSNLDKYKDKASRFSVWLEEHFIEGLTFFQYPKEHWRRIRTVDIVERFNQQQKRRGRVARLFPSVESCERLVVRIAMRIHEEWVIGKRDLKEY